MVQMPREENFVIFVDSCGKKTSCGSSVVADVIHLDSVMNKSPLSIPSCLPRSHGEKTQIKSSHLIALTPPPFPPQSAPNKGYPPAPCEAWASLGLCNHGY